ncbi:PREDICTED: aminopeptidase N-like, partial [Dinoponera quadriceps]|uniref:Aminopeptidase N-like n=1 Tax=Dinoponera quadriceps TaxID=609295 RepID=A0A6P3YB37_DINQU
MRIGVALLTLFLLIIYLLNGLTFTIAIEIDTSKPSKTCTFENLNYNLPGNVVPRNYEIKLAITNKYVIEGETIIVVEIIRTTAMFGLHAENLIIDSETIKLVQKAKVNNTDVVHMPMAYSYCKEFQILFLSFMRKLRPGHYVLYINYKGVIEDNLDLGWTKYVTKEEDAKYPRGLQQWELLSLLKFCLGNATRSFITILEPTGARRVFPCWDEPRFKATFNISVIHPPGMQVSSNMPQQTKKVVQGHQIQKTFMPTPVMCTYLVTIVIFEYLDESLPDGEEWFNLHVNDETRKLVQEIVTKIDSYLMSYTQSTWGRPTKIVVYPNLPRKAVGGWGFAVFRESDLLYERNINCPGFLINLWMTLTHGITQQYIESFVSPTRWSHLWLNRALELYLSYNILGKHFGEEQMMDLFVVQVLQPARHNDIAFNVPPIIHENDPFYSTLIYKKASAMIRLLGYIVTKGVLQQAILEYLSTYTYGSATPSDFFKIVDNETCRQTNKCHLNTTKIMSIWLSRRYYPTLLVTRNDTVNMTYVMYHETRSPNKTEWPETCVKQNAFFFDQNVLIWWLINNSSRTYNSCLALISRDPNDIIFSVQQYGYYRVNYDSRTWLKIAHFLDYNDHKDIYVSNRAQILDDAYHLVMEDKMNMSTYVSLTTFLRKETDFTVWHSMMNVLQYMSPFFKFPESEYFRKHMLKVIFNVLSRIRRNEDDNDNASLKATRLLLLDWSCKHGSNSCRQLANVKLGAYFVDPKQYPILPWWKDWTYCAGLMQTSHKIWNNVQDEISYKYDDPKMMQYLACNENDNMLKELLVSTTFRQNKWARLKDSQLKDLYHTIVKKHARMDSILDFIIENFNVIKLGYMSKLEKLANMIMSVYSEHQLYKRFKLLTEHSVSLTTQSPDDLK